MSKQKTTIKAKEKPKKAPKKPEIKQSMTFLEKGQIFALWDSKKSLASIAVTTGYGVKRLKWLIEAVQNTAAWKDAVKEWKDYDRNRKTTENERKHANRAYKRERSANKQRANKKNSDRGLRSVFNRATNKRTNSRRTKTSLSKPNQRLYQDRADTSGSHGSKGSRGAGAIVRSLRNSVEYKED